MFGDAKAAIKYAKTYGYTRGETPQVLGILATLYIEAGLYEDAMQTAWQARLLNTERDIAVYATAYRILKKCGNLKGAERTLKDINLEAKERREKKLPFTPAELVGLGKVAAEARMDPFQILVQFYKPAIKKEPNLLEG